ncbi:MAG: glycosyltransferase family 2 protein [Verrucomicrobia bacterium]|nr:glycosyltransferase family 2 protein [Verrucomicrobiota bacterium]
MPGSRLHTVDGYKTPSELGIPRSGPRDLPTPSTSPVYVLVTAVKNEERTLQTTIDSVLAQTVRPHEWVIVDDGSSDRTPHILSEVTKKNPWIRIVSRETSPIRDFANVARALNFAVNQLTVRHYEFLGVLDGDIRLPANYYEAILNKFDSDPTLGLAGGAVIDVGTLNMDGVSSEEIAGAVQLFRRLALSSCLPFAEIPEGGWDAVTNCLVRHAGFKTRTFRDIRIDHLKPRNSAQGGHFRRRWQYGERDYALGTGLGFQFSKCLFRMAEYPWVIGSIIRLTSYGFCRIRRRPRALSPALCRIMEDERRARLTHLIFKGRRW